MTHVLDEWVGYLQVRNLPLFAMNGILDGRCSCWRADTCDRPGKHPLSNNWQIEALNLDRTPEWANLGVRTGQGIIVIDIDDPKVANWLDYPSTFTVTTAAGCHLYYRHNLSRTFRTMVGWRQGVDIRAEGGLVVAPPSLHASGIRYMPMNDEPLADLPEELYHQIPAQAKRNDYVREPSTPAEVDAPNWGGMAEMLLEEMADAREGERNATLFRIASKLTEYIDAGMLRPLWLESLADAAHTAGLSYAEITRTIGSASGTSNGSAPRTTYTRVLSSPKDGG